MPPYTPVPRGRQRLGGALIAALGVGVAALVWQQARADGRFMVFGAMAGPAFAVLGLALVVWPGYKEERLARGEDITALQGAQLLTPRWWGVLVVALAAGVAYALALGWAP